MPITKSMNTKSIIHDFVHSKNSKFSGDSKKQRIKRALGAYYSMHKEQFRINKISRKVNEWQLDERAKPGAKAVDRLSKEETIAELSANVLRNYEKGAYREFKGGKEKRHKGLNRAGDKIAGVAKVRSTREETVNEALNIPVHDVSKGRFGKIHLKLQAKKAENDKRAASAKKMSVPLISKEETNEGRVLHKLSHMLFGKRIAKGKSKEKFAAAVGNTKNLRYWNTSGAAYHHNSPSTIDHYLGLNKSNKARNTTYARRYKKLTGEDTISELSRYAIGNYVHKAMDNDRKKTRELDSRPVWNNRDHIRADKDSAHLHRRRRHIEKAVDRLSKEETIAELSKDLHDRYFSAAQKDYKHSNTMAGAQLKRGQRAGFSSRGLSGYANAIKWKARANKRGEGLMRSAAKTSGIKGIHAKVMAT